MMMMMMMMILINDTSLCNPGNKTSDTSGQKLLLTKSYSLLKYFCFSRSQPIISNMLLYLLFFLIFLSKIES